MPQVTYPSRAFQELTDAEYNLIYRLMSVEPTAKVAAIKFAREQYGLGLSDAKSLCDSIANQPK